jgi:tetraacyldisaccharide 4'-kinase
VPPKDPPWWYGSQQSPVLPLLRPVGRLYGVVAEQRFRRTTPYRSRLPVICVGNFTAGGTGKTPLAIRIVEELKTRGQQPAFLTRGYGGRKSGPAWVAQDSDVAADVGDEALLLAAHAPTLISADRKAGARAIESEGRYSVIVMDDGLQNPGLAKNLTIAVIDGRRGFGNGEVIPAGPLRAPLDFQLGLVDAIVINGTPAEDRDPARGILERLRQEFPGPVIEARSRPKGNTEKLRGARVVAYAGIGHPERFFALLSELGAQLEATIAFPDHHAFSEADAERLMGIAATRGAGLVSTEKDLIRLRGADGLRLELYRQSRPLAIEVDLDTRESTRFAALIGAALKGSSAPP